MKRVLLILACANGAFGHGQVNYPPPRTMFNIKGSPEGVAGTCAGGVCYWFSEGCYIGCDKCERKGHFCGKLSEATLPFHARTYIYRGSASSDAMTKECGQAPWCAPGKAPIRSPCGVAGGSDEYDPGGNSGYTPKGVTLNQDGRTLAELDEKVFPKTFWQAGGVANISWSINANHGGGYQYRLCKKSENPTEQCFQATPLEFASEINYIQYCNQPVQLEQMCCDTSKWPNVDCKNDYKPCGEVVAYDAVDVSSGTIPVGSTWRRNPIPMCKGGAGGFDGQPCGKHKGIDPDDYQFKPLGRDKCRAWDPNAHRLYEYLGGAGAGGGCDQEGARYSQGHDELFSYNIVDEILVPNVPPGDYIMSWRWDTEQGPQVWSSCSDVTITDGPLPPRPPMPTSPPCPPSPPPSPTPPPTQCPGQGQCDCGWIAGGANCHTDDGSECFCRCCCDIMPSHTCKWHQLRLNATIVI